MSRKISVTIFQPGTYGKVEDVNIFVDGPAVVVVEKWDDGGIDTHILKDFFLKNTDGGRVSFLEWVKNIGPTREQIENIVTARPGEIIPLVSGLVRVD